MSVSSIPVMCYYNGHIVRTDNDVKYDGNKASIVPLEIPIDCTFEQLGKQQGHNRRSCKSRNQL